MIFNVQNQLIIYNWHQCILVNTVARLSQGQRFQRIVSAKGLYWIYIMSNLWGLLTTVPLCKFTWGSCNESPKEDIPICNHRKPSYFYENPEWANLSFRSTLKMNNSFKETKILSSCLPDKRFRLLYVRFVSYCPFRKIAKVAWFSMLYITLLSIKFISKHPLRFSQKSDRH